MDKEERIIGMESNIENFVASDLLKLRKRAPVMVTPALLAPGINARTWQNPIKNESLNEILFQFFSSIFDLSAINKMRANTILLIAITSIFLKNKLSNHKNIHIIAKNRQM